MSQRPSKIERALPVAVAGVAVLAVILLSFIPPADKQALHTRGRFHSLGHLLIFSLLAFLAIRASPSIRAQKLVCIGLMAFGFGLELAEHLVFLAPLEWKDVFVDAVGIAAGTYIAILSMQWWTARQMR
jgi:hypothetical protein